MIITVGWLERRLAARRQHWYRCPADTSGHTATQTSEKQQTAS